MIDEQKFKLRAYFLVPYNISAMQKGCQAIHAAFRYGRKFAEDEMFKDFVDNYETVIVLDGGTTNDERDFDGIAIGTLNQIGDQLNEHEIPFTFFIEPDLNHALTALCLICDERVFNKKDYPDFIKFLSTKDTTILVPNFIEENKTLQEIYPEYYKEWVRFIGGIKNVFLRELFEGKTKAS